METTKSNTTAIIAYITIIGLVIAYFMNADKKEAFTSYHIRQSLGLAAIAIAISIIGLVPVLGWIVTFVGFFALLYLWIIGLMNAVNNKEKPLPFVGVKFEEWFKDIHQKTSSNRTRY